MAMLAGIGDRIRQLGQWVAPPVRLADAASRKAQVLAVAAQKGGVGKTTTAVHLAASLAMHHEREVLLIDLDAQGHVASSLRAHVRERPAASLSQVLLGRGRDVTEAAIETTVPGLWSTGADKALGETEAMLATRIGRELLLKASLQRALGRFDVIVMDCPPNLGLLTINALCAADHVLVPSDLSILAIEGVDDLFQTLEALRASFQRAPGVLGLVYTRVDARNAQLNATIRGAASERYGRHVLQTEIASNAAVSRAQLRGQLVFKASPGSAGARHYRALSAEVASKLFGEAGSTGR